MNDVTALRYIAGLLEFLRLDNTLPEIINALYDAEQEHRASGDEREAIIASKEADLLGATQRELDTLIQWAEQKLKTIEEGKKYIPF